MLRSVRYFLHLEATGGLLLLAAATFALLVTNSEYLPYYQAFLAWHPQIAVGDLMFSFSLSHAINDGLMALFFLMVGLEIKREMIEGELASRKTAMLPVVAALGGVVAPALIFVLFNSGTADLRGWAIPTATDIAFSLAVLTLFGSRLNPSLKIFLMALAVIDDLAAVLIIAVFYTQHIDTVALFAAILLTGVLWGFNRLNINRAWPYVAVGVLLWLAVLQSGVHATIAGVLIGALVPMQPKNNSETSPPKNKNKRFKRMAALRARIKSSLIEAELDKPSLGKSMIVAIHPWVAFLIMPLFAFANAGIPLGDLTLDHAFDPLTLGIAFGLLLGKPIGIVGAAWLLKRFTGARLPEGVNWMQFLGVAALAGIGFTMSLFIGELAFGQASVRALQMKLGIISGSLLSALLGCAVLAMSIITSKTQHAR